MDELTMEYNNYNGIITKPPMDELYHYGKLGMKWGVRHDQDKAWIKAGLKLRKRKKKYDKAMLKQRAKYDKVINKTNKKLEKSLKEYERVLTSFKKEDDHNKVTKIYLENRNLVNQLKDLYKQREAPQGKAFKAYRKFEEWNEDMRKAFIKTKYSKHFSYKPEELEKAYKTKLKSSGADFDGDSSVSGYDLFKANVKKSFNEYAQKKYEQAEKERKEKKNKNK